MADGDASWWRSTWPLTRSDWIRLAVAYASTVAVGVVVGVLLFRLDPTNPLTALDERVANWFVDRRTDGRTTAATWGAGIADTPVKIGLSAIVVVALLWKLRRWREALLVALSLTFEASAYLITSIIVGRPRPNVEQLLESPVSTTFPSGHVAAATVYGAFVVIVFWHSRSALARGVAVTLCLLAIASVGVARIYQGMHYLSDVVAGIVLGIVSLVICARLVGAPDDAISTPLQPTAEPVSA